jgi:hypothetical protein
MHGDSAPRTTEVIRGARIDLLFTMSDNTSAMRQLPPALEYGFSRTNNGIGSRLVEPDGIEPTTSCLQSRRSPN